jgi:hypothetical protein
LPDTFLGLAILILLFMPGAVYAIQADRQRPATQQSALRELITIAGVGTICDLAVLLVFSIFHTLWPGLSPNIGGMERSGFPYFRLHLVVFGWWIFALFIASCVLAWVLGSVWPGVANRYISGQISLSSAWWKLLKEKNPDELRYLSCDLTDGTYVGGYLLSFNPDSEETENRELTLTGPITYRASGDEEAVVLPNIHVMTIRAGHMRNMGVTYLDSSYEIPVVPANPPEDTE